MAIYFCGNKIYLKFIFQCHKGPQTLEICEPFLISEGAEAHARGGGDGREEGRERSYYDLHCDLDDTFLHRLCLPSVKDSVPSARRSSPRAGSPS